jgi:molecular chaperone GrpE
VTQGPHEGDNDNGRPIVRDRRRIDPKTYQVRDPDAASPAPADPPSDQPGAGPAAEKQTEQPEEPSEVEQLTAEVEKLKATVADRTSDLQRVQAEYVNYKRRVDRDRDLARTNGIESVLRELLGVLDSINLARDHDELTGGFKGVADEINKLAGRYGLEAFGEPGDPFDPRIHEALMHAQAEGISGPTAVTILQSGYKIKDRVIRPARVAVAEPSESDTETEEATDGDDSAEQV